MHVIWVPLVNPKPLGEQHSSPTTAYMWHDLMHVTYLQEVDAADAAPSNGMEDASASSDKAREQVPVGERGGRKGGTEQRTSGDTAETLLVVHAILCASSWLQCDNKPGTDLRRKQHSAAPSHGIDAGWPRICSITLAALTRLLQEPTYEYPEDDPAWMARWEEEQRKWEETQKAAKDATTQPPDPALVAEVDRLLGLCADSSGSKVCEHVLTLPCTKVSTCSKRGHQNSWVAKHNQWQSRACIHVLTTLLFQRKQIQNATHSTEVQGHGTICPTKMPPVVSKMQEC